MSARSELKDDHNFLNEWLKDITGGTKEIEKASGPTRPPHPSAEHSKLFFTGASSKESGASSENF